MESSLPALCHRQDRDCREHSLTKSLTLVFHECQSCREKMKTFATGQECEPVQESECPRGRGEVTLKTLPPTHISVNSLSLTDNQDQPELKSGPRQRQSARQPSAWRCHLARSG